MCIKNIKILFSIICSIIIFNSSFNSFAAENTVTMEETTEIIEESTIENETTSLEIDGKKYEKGEVTTEPIPVYKGEGYVTMIGDVVPGLNPSMVYVSFYNINTYDEYNYSLNAFSDYLTHFALPAGTYKISEVKLPGDYIYTNVERIVFEITPGQTNFIEIQVGDEPEVEYLNEDIINKKYEEQNVIENEGIVEEIETTESESIEYFDEQEREEKKSGVSNILTNILLNIVSFGIIGFCLYYIKKRKG